MVGVAYCTASLSSPRIKQLHTFSPSFSTTFAQLNHSNDLYTLLLRSINLIAMNGKTNLTGVRAALKASECPDAAIFTSLLDGGSLMPYKSVETARQKYASHNVEYPGFGRDQAPAAFRPAQSSKDLRDICLRDLPEAREDFGNRLQYLVSHDKHEVPEDANHEQDWMQTINALVGDNTTTPKMVVMFPSDTLEMMWDQTSWTPPENFMYWAQTTCNVLPTNTMLPLHHSNEGTTITTLLAGEVVWVVWPPTAKNLDIFESAYKKFAEDFDETKLDVASDLEGGVTFVQTVGDGLRIPPFLLMMGLSTSTSVLASGTQVTINDFISMLSRLSLLKAWYQTEIDGVEKQSRFIASILSWLELLLLGDPDDEVKDGYKLPRTRNGLLSELVSRWDVIKNDLTAMMGPSDSKAMELIWEDFVVGHVGRECRICGKRIDNKQKRMKKHFIANHWVQVKPLNNTGSGMAQGNEAAGDGEAMDVDD